MNSEPHGVIEYQTRHDPAYVDEGPVTDPAVYGRWTRDPPLEIDVRPKWVIDLNRPNEDAASNTP